MQVNVHLARWRSSPRCECCGAPLAQLKTGQLICPQPACPNPTTIAVAQLELGNS